ncbi:MAG: glycosyltransferase [Sphingobacteriia bacterium]|nr:glycosyltransferase [Sphingobacteriia bacterium]
MKVLIVTNNFPPIIDGVGDYSFELYKRLKDKGINIHVAIKKQNEVIKYINEEGLQNEVFSIIKKWNFFECISLFRFITRSKYDSLCLQYVPYSFSKYGTPISLLMLFILCRLSGIKVFVFFHEVSVRSFGLGIKSSFLSIIQRTIAWAICMLSNSVATSIDLYKKFLFPFRALIIPIPPNFAISPLNNSFKDENLIICFTNRYCSTIGSAVNNLIKKGYTVKLVLIGKANAIKENEIISEIQSNQFEDFIVVDKNFDKKHIEDVFSKAGIYVQLEPEVNYIKSGISFKSGTLAAAMSASCCIIGTAGDMTNMQILKDGINFIEVDGSSVTAIESSIENIFSDNNLKQSLRAGSYTVYQNYLSWSNSINKYLNFLNLNE